MSIVSDGASVPALVQGDRCPLEFQFSPDGRYFAYYRERPGEADELDRKKYLIRWGIGRDFVILDTRTGESVEIAHSVGESTATHFPLDPQWSDSSRFVLYTRQSGFDGGSLRSERWGYDTATGERRLWGSGVTLSWAPGQDALIRQSGPPYTESGPSIFELVDIPGGTATELARFDDPERRSSSWQPLGPGVIEIDGPIRNPCSTCFSVDLRTLKRGSTAEGRMLGDQRLGRDFTVWDGGPWGCRGIYVFFSAHSKERCIADAEDGMWNADGSALAYVVSDSIPGAGQMFDDLKRIYLFSVSTNSVRFVTEMPGGGSCLSPVLDWVDKNSILLRFYYRCGLSGPIPYSHR